jgi:hypothetical protein
VGLGGSPPSQFLGVQILVKGETIKERGDNQGKRGEGGQTRTNEDQRGTKRLPKILAIEIEREAAGHEKV